MERDRRKYNILVVEDNPGDQLLIEDFLEERILAPEITQAETLKEALAFLDCKTPYDVILLDLTLPGQDREDLIKNIVPNCNGAPVLALTGYTDFDFSVKSLSLGVADYLLKDELGSESLYKSIRYNIERRKTYRQLAESEKKYSDLFHLSPQPMFVFEHDTFKLLDVNNAAVSHYGYSREEFLNMKVPDLKPKGQEGEVEKVVKDTRGIKPGTSIGVHQHQKKNGEVIHVDIRVSDLEFKGKKARLSLQVDITERLRYIAAIEQQNKRLKEIAWTQSHVVRAPLARLMGLVDMLEDLKSAGMSQEELLKMVMDSGRELDDIIKEITDKAQDIHSENGEMESKNGQS